jgi:hypothetical protein
MRTTIDLPDELYRELKIEAVRRQQKLKEIVPELLRMGLRIETASAREDERDWMEEWLAQEIPLMEGKTVSELIEEGRNRLEPRTHNG